jgi:hypothetical protein
MPNRAPVGLELGQAARHQCIPQTLRHKPGNGVGHVHTYAQLAGDEIVVGLNRNGVVSSLVDHRFATSNETSAAESLHRIGLHYWL